MKLEELLSLEWEPRVLDFYEHLKSQDQDPEYSDFADGCGYRRKVSPIIEGNLNHRSPVQRVDGCCRCRDRRFIFPKT